MYDSKVQKSQRLIDREYFMLGNIMNEARPILTDLKEAMASVGLTITDKANDEYSDK